MLESIFKARSQELIELYEATKKLPETKELDVIIYDKENLTFFRPLALWLGERVYPSEGVYMAIEVERLLSPKRLVKVLNKLIKAKRLPREACYLSGSAVYTSYQLYGREWRVPPLLTMIFAYDCRDLGFLAEKLEQYIEENNLNPWEYPDLISILKKGYIAWSENGNIALTPTRGSRPLPVKAEPYQTLAFTYMRIIQIIGQLQLPPIDALKYMKGFSFGTKI